MNWPSKTVLVFGHYDSRGGTVAVEIKERSMAEALAGFRRYDRVMFGIRQPGEPATRTVYGMQMRAADKAVHELIYGKGSPAVEDFLFVAEIHDTTGLNKLDISSDLDTEEADEPTVVLIDENTAPPEYHLHYPEQWQSMSVKSRDAWTHARNVEYSEWVRATLDITLQTPVQLEIVSPALIPVVNTPEDHVPDDWWGQFAKKLSSASRRGWDDDAFGFYFLIREAAYEEV